MHRPPLLLSLWRPVYVNQRPTPNCVRIQAFFITHKKRGASPPINNTGLRFGEADTRSKRTNSPQSHWKAHTYAQKRFIFGGGQIKRARAALPGLTNAVHRCLFAAACMRLQSKIYHTKGVWLLCGGITAAAAAEQEMHLWMASV